MSSLTQLVGCRTSAVGRLCMVSLGYFVHWEYIHPGGGGGGIGFLYSVDQLAGLLHCWRFCRIDWQGLSAYTYW